MWMSFVKYFEDAIKWIYVQKASIFISMCIPYFSHFLVFESVVFLFFCSWVWLGSSSSNLSHCLSRWLSLQKGIFLGLDNIWPFFLLPLLQFICENEIVSLWRMTQFNFLWKICGSFPIIWILWTKHMALKGLEKLENSKLFSL